MNRPAIASPHAAATPHTRAILTLDRGVLLYDDIRQFGRIGWSEGLPQRLERLGPDALSIGDEQLAAMLKPSGAQRFVLRSSSL